MNIVAYRGDDVVWCPDCAQREYGAPQVGELVILDAAGEQVIPIFDPGSALHLVVTCAGACGASVPVPRPPRSEASIHPAPDRL